MGRPPVGSGPSALLRAALRGNDLDAGHFCGQAVREVDVEEGVADLGPPRAGEDQDRDAAEVAGCQCSITTTIPEPEEGLDDIVVE